MASKKTTVRSMFQKTLTLVFLNGFNLGMEQSNNMNNPNAHTDLRSIRAPITNASQGKEYPDGL